MEYGYEWIYSAELAALYKKIAWAFLNGFYSLLLLISQREGRGRMGCRSPDES